MPEAPPEAAKAPGAAELTAVHGNGQADTFERLIEQARRAHDVEVEKLRREVQRLRSQLASGGQQEGGAAGSSPKYTSTEAGLKWPREESATEDARQAGSPDTVGQQRLSSETMDTVQSQLSVASSKRIHRGLSGSLHHEQLDPAQHRGEILYRITHHWAFEMFIAVLIVANGLAIAAEAQYHGISLAKTVGHESAGGNPRYSSPNIPKAFDVVNWCFGVLFMIEVIMRIGATHIDYLKSLWNWLDLTIVIMWTLGEATEIFFDAQILRLARLARLMRLVRLVKHMKSRNFDSLYLMATALSGSLSVLMWSFSLMFLVHLVLGLAINQCLREVYFESDPAKAAAQVEVFEYFGSFSRAFLTMFEITLANWPTPCRVLVEQVSEWFVIYAILHKMTLGFAAIGIINAIFVQETFKVASADNHVMVKQTMHKQRLHREKMARLFEEADEDGDGRVTLNEWQQVCQDDWVKAWLASQDVNASDAEKLFAKLDNGDGHLTADELIQGTARLKGPSQAMVVMETVLAMEKTVLDMDKTVQGMDSFLKEVKDDLLAQRPVASERDQGGNSVASECLE